MATNIRELAERHLGATLEGGFSLPVVLIDPDGVEYDDLRGQVLYDTTGINPDTGQLIVNNNPIVSLRVSSLTRVPAAGENWLVRIPTTPSETAEKADFVISPTRSPQGGASIGFIRLYLSKAVQS